LVAGTRDGYGDDRLTCEAEHQKGEGEYDPGSGPRIDRAEMFRAITAPLIGSTRPQSLG
jgi:hypothetical protein